ncbi:MAG: hypothetical protein ABIR78_05940 [Ferruginibacter sp.]
MSKTNAFETNLLNHIFKNVAIGNIGDATGLPAAATVGNLYVSLHTADPGETGDQTTSEATFTGYARMAVIRSAVGWTISGTTQIANAAAITFAACTAGTNTITHFGIGTSLSGVGNLLYKGAFSSSLAISNGITPEISIGALVITED